MTDLSDPLISLPKQFDGFTLSAVAADIVGKCPNGWPPRITFDFSSLGFVKPAGVVFLSNLIHWINRQGTWVHFTNLSANTAIVFLDDSLFFEQHFNVKLRPAARPRGTTLPLLKIAHKDSHAWLDLTFVPWIAGRLSITKPSLFGVKSCLSELFNNIQDHTQYDIGSIFVQHYPNKKEITVSLADFGLGIPENVRKVLPELNDSEAIVKSVEQGFTTKSKPTNSGLGLDQLLKTVVLGNGGQVTIYSRYGIVRFDKSGTSIQSYAFPNVGFCPGTTIDISLRTDTIEVLPDEREELQW